jgi:hypothetical protein
MAPAAATGRDEQQAGQAKAYPGWLGSSFTCSPREFGAGLRGVAATATKVGGHTLMNDKNWRTTLMAAVANSDVKFTVSLDGFSGSSTYS